MDEGTSHLLSDQKLVEILEEGYAFPNVLDRLKID